MSIQFGYTILDMLQKHWKLLRLQNLSFIICSDIFAYNHRYSKREKENVYVAVDCHSYWSIDDQCGKIVDWQI